MTAGPAVGTVAERVVVVTRDEGPDGPLTARLRAHGLSVLHWPTIRSAPPADPGPLEDALRALEAFDWAVFTSPRGVAAVVDRGVPQPATLRVAAVGEATARALEEAGWRVAVVPDTQTGAALVGALRAGGLEPGSRVLFPASGIARDTVPDGLTEAGAEVVQVEAYTTEPARPDADAVRAALAGGRVGWITFTSPSSVDNLEAGLGRALLDALTAAAGAVAIGPTTAEAVRAAGFRHVAVADPHSLDGLAERVAREAARPSITEE